MKIIKELKNLQLETESYFILPDADLKKSYEDGKWNVQFLLHHITDAETVMYERIRRTISKPDQVIWGFDQNAWASQLNYASLSLDINLNVFSAVRSAIIQLASVHYPNSETKWFVHSETGKRTLKDEFDKICWHNEHHLRQIRKALS